MQIKSLTTKLQQRTGAPSELTPEVTSEALSALDGWREDAQALARGGESSMQKEVEQLVGAMTEGELEAAQRLHATCMPMLADIAEQEHKMSGAPFDDLESLFGASWWVFLRVLLTYDEEKGRLSTHLYQRAPAHFREHITDARRTHQGSTSETHERVRRTVRRAQSSLEDPSIEEITDYVLERCHSERQTARSATRDKIASILDDRPDRRLHARAHSAGEGEDLRVVDVTPSGTRTEPTFEAEAGLQAVGKALGEEELASELSAACEAAHH
ncbi:DNA-directed RNA polymerase specialized sigma subunit [Salinibacter ruber]|uniref:hypothetical protein n=1 Tax=Salinibacter ruber TaxID=146919 RepID=UPI0021686EFD|nr:hypothetical protein [Salinibacter ruber]MCS3827421.1 DNA-directed RNA polymerase specialized sigma subunit [Salinibacter ruber]